MSASENWTITMTELPGVIEGGMPGKNGQRKPGTTRGSPRRSRTAKASRISRPAVKSRCASEWGGWGRLSDDGPGQHNPDPSEDPWGGGYPPSTAVHWRVTDPTLSGIFVDTNAMHEGRKQTNTGPAHGEIEFNIFGERWSVPGSPEIVVVSNVSEGGKPIGVRRAGENWHSDMCYTARPPRGTMLYALEIPQLSGLPLGDTEFASAAAAWSALPEALQQRLRGRRAVFDFCGRKR